MVGICQNTTWKVDRAERRVGRFNRFLAPVSKIKSGNQYAKDVFKSSSPKRVLC